jgi:hypothetical protein
MHTVAVRAPLCLVALRAPGASRGVHKDALRAPEASPLGPYIVPEFCFEKIISEIINTRKVLLASKCVPRVKSACGRSPEQLLPNFRFFPLLTHQDLPSCQISSSYDIGKCSIILMSESVSQS